MARGLNSLRDNRSAEKTGKIPAADRLTTLLVDDDDFVLKSMPSFLSRVPEIEVVGTARDGVEALEKLRISQPKIVLMDVRMPRMGGIEAAVIMLREFPKLRVVLTSGIDDPEMRAECLATGAHGFMAKLEVITQFPMLVKLMFGTAA
ncbi:MAG: response regulator transcription factor [Chthoniobacteraceae bacterium]